MIRLSLDRPEVHETGDPLSWRLDEVVADNAAVHLEMMTESSALMILRTADGYYGRVAIFIHKGKLVVTGEVERP
jgi:hypothetical protein